jgi:23S rRNA (pseudouridine1915-N3)-methyltransferase
LGILVYCIENHKNPHIDLLCEDFQKKTKGIFSFQFIKISGAKSTRPEEQKLLETASIEKKIKPNDTLILCDERGKSYNSLELGKHLEHLLHYNRGNVIIALGGAYGFTPEAREKYPTWKLSDLVFPHHIARLIVAEQLYRCSQILKNSGYHHE